MGYETGPYSLDMTGLPTGTTVYYRAKARNSAGWGYGDEQSFIPCDPAEVITQTPTDLGPTSATGQGFITSTGGVNCDEAGFEWGTEPGVYTNSVTDTGDFGYGSFSKELTGLPSDSTIYYRAKAHNPRGWTYGDEVTFTTGAVAPPTVSIDDPTDITPESFIGHATIDDTGGEDASEVGFEWGTATGSYIKYVSLKSGAWGAESFSIYIADLPLERTIYIRAVACNSAGCGYSDEIFLGPPSVLTHDATDIGLTSAQGNGEITSIEGLDADERGFEWGTDPGFLPNGVTEEGTFSTGEYSLTLDGLPSHVTIYYRSRAHNPRGWEYGDVKTFFTVHKPEVSTVEVAPSDTPATQAPLKGAITDSGDEPSDIRGFDWGTEPGVHPNSETQEGSFEEGAFEIQLTGLDPGTTIYYRAKAHNPAGWGYGEEKSLQTSQVPQLTTQDATSVGAIRARVNGSINDCSGEECADISFEYGTSSCSPGEYPYSIGATEAGGTYHKMLSGIEPATKYYYRFRARNSAGWGYGDEKTFVTDPVELPVIITLTTWDIRAYSARARGQVNWDGGEPVDQCGFEWGLSSGSYPNSVEFGCSISTYHADSPGDVEFSGVLSDLPQDTTIYMRAKAHNRAGWGYGPEATFTTREHTYPSVSTVGATNVDEVSATLSGNITDDGGWDCYERGFVWGTTPGTYSYDVTEEGTYRDGEFSINVTGLPSHTTIYYKAMARNGVGWAYGNEKTFVTEYVPSLSTGNPSDITLDGVATGHGSITSIGAERCDKRGFEWGTDPEILTHEVIEEGDFDTGGFSLAITGMPTCTRIYYRAKAHNPTGWGYGPVVSFWTKTVPNVETRPTFMWPLSQAQARGCLPGISTTGASLRAEIRGTGGLEVDEMGVEWGTSPDALDNDVTDTGSFGYEYYWTKWVDALPDCTRIYYRGKAHNACGWGYGDIRSIRVGYTPELSQQAWRQYEYYGEYWWARHCTYATRRVHLDDDGCGNVDKVGIEWGTESGIYTDEKIEEGSYGWGFFSFVLDGLPVATRIYYRGKAHNECGWGYQPEQSFVTGHLPDLDTDDTPSDEIRALHAMLHGTITDTGVHPYTCDEVGFEWSTTTAPPYENEITKSGSFYQRGHYGYDPSYMTGEFSMEASLPSDTKIYYRAKAHNDGGWGYGQERSLTTLPLYLPDVSTGDASNITAHEADVEGEILHWGNEYCDERGIEWGTESGEYTNEVTETGEFVEGVYSMHLSGLTSSTTIYYRAKVHNPAGWNYGEEKTFATQTITPPDVVTDDVTDLGPTYCTGNGRITDTNWEEADEVGFEWGTTSGSYPNSVTGPGPYGVEPFSLTISDFPTQTTIYYRAKAHNSAGWGYGDEVAFETTVPLVDTGSPSDIKQTSAKLAGEVTGLGGAESCDRTGVEWGYNPGLYTRSTVTIGTLGLGTFDESVYGFEPDSTVCYRAKAHSSIGWGYGDEVCFDTLVIELPAVGTRDPTNIQEDAAIARGEIENTGGEDCDERGFEWGTSPGSYPNSVTETGAFRAGLYWLDLTGLPSGPVYYRAKAHNSEGWAYGDEVSFNTSQPGAVGASSIFVHLLTD